LLSSLPPHIVSRIFTTTTQPFLQVTKVASWNTETIILLPSPSQFVSPQHCAWSQLYPCTPIYRNFNCRFCLPCCRRHQ
jgi:hypothetical protein